MDPAELEHAQSLLQFAHERASIEPLAALDALDRLIAWCQATRLQCVESLAATGDVHRLEPGPSRSQHDIDSMVRGSDVARRAPGFLAALRCGDLSLRHIEELGHSMHRLDSAQRAALLRDEARLLAVASASTAAGFARFLRREERRLGRQSGADTLEQQRRAGRLRSRTDRETGMRHYSLWLDPLSALTFEQRLDAAVEAMFHDAPPPGCPSDPFERQEFLRAHALLALSEGGAGRSGRPEFVVVVDATDPENGVEVDWGLPVEIPLQVLHDLWGSAEVLPVIVRNGVVLHAPGELHLGRTTRLANRAQRRALRAMYPRCAIPGCDTRFEHCNIHHVRWWRHGGPPTCRICSRSAIGTIGTSTTTAGSSSSTRHACSPSASPTGEHVRPTHHDGGPHEVAASAHPALPTSNRGTHR